jgi:hypothetical protein
MTTRAPAPPYSGELSRKRPRVLDILDRLPGCHDVRRAVGHRHPPRVGVDGEKLTPGREVVGADHVGSEIAGESPTDRTAKVAGAAAHVQQHAGGRAFGQERRDGAVDGVATGAEAQARARLHIGGDHKHPKHYS